MTHYHVLGVSVDADEGAIRSAYRNLARRYHPDAGEGSSVERFREVVEAYETLIDPQRRRSYDLSLRHVQPGGIRAEPMSVWAEPLRPRTPTQVNLLFEYRHRVGWNDFFIDEFLRAIDDLWGPPLFRW
jgi:curved DNA-binding protein CbpA